MGLCLASLSEPGRDGAAAGPAEGGRGPGPAALTQLRQQLLHAEPLVNRLAAVSRTPVFREKKPSACVFGQRIFGLKL